MNRREFLTSAGALVVSFSIPLPAVAQAAEPKLEQLDAWLAVGQRRPGHRVLRQG